MTAMDSADDGYAQPGGYTAAQAAHTFEQFLEGHLTVQGFSQWLDGYRPGANAPRDPGVENEINTALLALRALQHGTRTRQEVHREILNGRSRLTGLARG
ncbi:MAG TPA: hypothetical protein VNK05_13415 [Chloroflexota bacterium]|jgi:hypothetical protein|nr:hypothetical protein [Chloroflexota bacterium]